MALSRTSGAAAPCVDTAAALQLSRGVAWRTTVKRVLTNAVTGVALLLAIVLLQVGSGAYKAEFSGHQDEAAHYISGLMVHDYIRLGAPDYPIRFAEKYYIHYPRVAIGHWPPGLYVVQTAWALIFSPSKTSIVFLMAVIAAAFALLVFIEIRRRFGTIAAVLLTAALVMSPALSSSASLVMADTLVAALCLVAVSAWADYVQTGRARYAILFGVYAALALLTKTSAVALVLVPAVSVPAAGAWRLLRRYSFWLPALIVAAAWLPWHFYTRRMVENGLFVAGNRLAWAIREAQIATRLTAELFGVVVFAAAIAGLILTVVRPVLRRRPVDAYWASMAGLVAGTYLLYMTVPAGVESRRMLVIAPAVLLFAAAACHVAAVRLGNARAATAGLLVLTASAFILSFRIQPKPVTHYGDIVRLLREDMRSSTRQPRWVIAADSPGEGAFVCEVASTEERPRSIVLRASKLLVSARWSGDAYTPRYNGPHDILRLADEVSATHAVVVTSEVRAMPHVRDLARSLESSPNWVRLTVPASYQVAVFRRVGMENLAQKRIRLEMEHMLKRAIEQ